MHHILNSDKCHNCVRNDQNPHINNPASKTLSVQIHIQKLNDIHSLILKLSNRTNFRWSVGGRRTDRRWRTYNRQTDRRTANIKHYIPPLTCMWYKKTNAPLPLVFQCTGLGEGGGGGVVCRGGGGGG